MSCNCINNKPCNPDDNQKPQDSTQVINNIVYNQADNEDLEEVIQDGKSVLHFKDKLVLTIASLMNNRARTLP